VDPDPLLLRRSGRAGNRTWTSGSVARNSDHWTTEAVESKIYYGIKHEWLVETRVMEQEANTARSRFIYNQPILPRSVSCANKSGGSTFCAGIGLQRRDRSGVVTGACQLRLAQYSQRTQ
jgi:hypothetical protein